MHFARPLEKLIDELQKLPTIGPKTAQRLALYILKTPEEEVRKLAEAIIDAKSRVFPCSRCGYLTDIDPCPICRDEKRDKSILCVAEEAGDIIAIERTGFKGQYFVLNKDFNLMGHDDLGSLNIKPLEERLKTGEVKEVILALNPDIDGEILARFLAGVVEKYGVKVTRLAHGIPVGGYIEFADEITLRRAIEGRREI
ncbi:DNA replication and repair protein RecR [Thermosyntropha lipolytica DSM 11003]|uniref:Recombination protein RecR n=1 Tax=Thermosyntropha lipolytica DSM 11003 TaxID=1123382 RepID=A0A1M5RA17_9FIRM|nr:recombination mediator RecR [Thermosyntropha lipolytica]SHH23008.1 DNA replication and repair protein RecR [Thermosyntropha lipolytica DSM 11003]